MLQLLEFLSEKNMEKEENFPLLQNNGTADLHYMYAEKSKVNCKVLCWV